MSKSVLVPIAHSIEEIEAVTITDTLRRAGVTVTVASCNVDNSINVEASRGVRLLADCPISECTDTHYDIIALPGGMPGAEHLRDCQALTDLLISQQQMGHWIAAICASPAVVLAHHGLLEGIRATAHPSFQSQLTGAVAINEPLVIDEETKIITSQGPGTVMYFSLNLAKILYGEIVYRELATAMVADWAL